MMVSFSRVKIDSSKVGSSQLMQSASGMIADGGQKCTQCVCATRP